MPEVSVIVPVYKVEQYLRPCVDSVLAQSFTDFELILVDDGSPDACGAICDEYAARDGRVRVIHQENAGQGKARNVGTDRASGKYIIFLDSDDYWLPSALDTLYAEAERNQTQVLVFGAKRFCDGMEQPKHVNPDYSPLHVQNGAVMTGPESLKISLDNLNSFLNRVSSSFYCLICGQTGSVLTRGSFMRMWFFHFFLIFLPSVWNVLANVCIGTENVQVRL